MVTRIVNMMLLAGAVAVLVACGGDDAHESVSTLPAVGEPLAADVVEANTVQAIDRARVAVPMELGLESSRVDGTDTGRIEVGPDVTIPERIIAIERVVANESADRIDPPEPEPEPEPESEPDDVTGGSIDEIEQVWLDLAECESNQRWDYNGSSGYDGGLQFLPSTWIGVGGDDFAPYAWQATPFEQVTVAKRLLEVQGWGAWPSCSRQLGLR